ncbi:MAG TPA: bifunctional glutamine synthetase adenylyltransferase/deadenyltransferase, partial [Burkholderiales bacterium]
MSSVAATPNDLPHAVARACRLSRYVRDLLSAEPALGSTVPLGAPLDRAWMRERIRGATDEDAALKTALRRLRKTVMLGLITRDLDGRADLAEVVATVTALAEETVGTAAAAHAQWLAQEFGQPVGASSGTPQQLQVIAMGKLGGGELNVSSDIDVVFAYPEDGETDGARRISNHEFFVRLARKVISAIAEVTADGFVFRVDTRLRPYGDSGPLAVSYD